MRNRISLLVVDDDAVLRLVLSIALEGEGFRVTAVSGGQAALDALAGGLRPASILLDLSMPGMDGLEFRRRQLAQPTIASIPVVILTATMTPEVVASAHALGIRHVTAKPVDLGGLLYVIAQAMGLRS